jgi:hypothetical protein
MDLRVQRQRKGRRRWIAIVVVLAALVWGMNTVMISRPVAAALAADQRAAGIGFTAHLRYFLDPSTLSLDLARMQAADTADLFRGLLLAAGALDRSAWSFRRFVLSRAGDAIYSIPGPDLYQLAHDYALSRKPAAVLATLLTKLRLAGSQGPAPATVEEAARLWATGRP